MVRSESSGPVSGQALWTYTGPDGFVALGTSNASGAIPHIKLNGGTTIADGDTTFCSLHYLETGDVLTVDASGAFGFDFRLFNLGGDFTAE